MRLRKGIKEHSEKKVKLINVQCLSEATQLGDSQARSEPQVPPRLALQTQGRQLCAGKGPVPSLLLLGHGWPWGQKMDALEVKIDWIFKELWSWLLSVDCSRARCTIRTCFRVFSTPPREH